LSDQPGGEGKFNYLRGTTTGGAASGTFGDTDTVTWSVYLADDAETVLENIKDGHAAQVTGTWITSGMQYRDKIGRRGRFATVVLSDATASKSWGVERITGDITPLGKD
jgi:hypothetical protein